MKAVILMRVRSGEKDAPQIFEELKEVQAVVAACMTYGEVNIVAVVEVDNDKELATVVLGLEERYLSRAEVQGYMVVHGFEFSRGVEVGA